MKKQEPNPKVRDLREGVRGALTPPTVPLAGGEPMYALEDPPIASPDLSAPAGQTTHQ